MRSRHHNMFPFRIVCFSLPFQAPMVYLHTASHPNKQVVACTIIASEVSICFEHRHVRNTMAAMVPHQLNHSDATST